MAKDIHDLFGDGEEDESDGSADEPEERSDGPDDSAERVDRSPPGDGESVVPTGPSRDARVESERTSSSVDSEDESGESGPAWASSDETTETDADAPEPVWTTSLREAVEDDPRDVESAASRTPADPDEADRDDSSVGWSTTTSGATAEDEPSESEPSDPTSTFSLGAAEDEPRESEPPEPTSTYPGEASEDDPHPSEGPDQTRVVPDRSTEADPDEPAASGPTTRFSDAAAEDDSADSSLARSPTTPERAVRDGHGESEPTDSRTPTAAPVDGDRDRSEPTASTTSPPTSTEDGSRTLDSAGQPSAAGGVVEDDPDQSEPGTATDAPEDPPSAGAHASEPSGTPAAAAGTAVDEPGTPAPGGATTATGDTAVGDEAFETSSPDEPGSTASGRAADAGDATTASGTNRLATGIDALDRAMGGGVPPGRLVVLVADPGVQSELIVDSVLSQRDTLFVTTDRPDWEVMKDIEPGLGSGEVTIREHTPDSLLSGLDTLLDQIGTSSNFIIDSVNELELVPRQRYRIFLSDVKRRLFETGSLGLLTGVTVGHESARDLTLRRADIVWRLETRTTDRAIENRLTVPKFRGGAAMTETVKLELTDEIRVDTSEDAD